MSYYRRLIEESEKKRILGMHNKYKEDPRILNIREAYSAQAGEGYDSVEACKKELPYNVATKLGINWNEAKKSWGSKGTSQENLQLRNAMCDGWRVGDSKDGAKQGSVSVDTKDPQYGSGTQGIDQQIGSVDEFLKKESGDPLLSAFGPERFDVFKKLPNLIQGTIGQYGVNDLTEFPSLKGKLPTTDFLYWVSNTQKPGENITLYLENGLIIRRTMDGKDFEILGDWLKGNTTTQGDTNNQSTTNNQGSASQKQKFIEPIF
jgi:hypothetical protein